MKKNRQMKILEIISKFEVETQDDLIDLLKKEDYYVTQATISRDIRELDLIKITTPSGKYKYTVGSHSSHEAQKKSHIGNAVLSAIRSIDYGQNIIVLKTLPGMSDAVAIEIDRIQVHEILGCISGDDTIFVAIRDTDSARRICEKMKELLEAR